METMKKERYSAPEMEVLSVKMKSILCGSEGAYRDDYEYYNLDQS